MASCHRILIPCILVGTNGLEEYVFSVFKVVYSIAKVCVVYTGNQKECTEMNKYIGD
jgi:hypothetical protein